MTAAPRTVEEALAFARAEHTSPSQNWKGYCQRFVRTAYGIGPLFDSAWAQWLGADDEDKHPGTDPAAAPLGAALCFRGGEFGHIMLAARDGGAWSNDLVRSGGIDWAPRTAPVTKWGQTYVGWLSAVNDYDLPIDQPGPATPKPGKRYAALDRAVDRLETALATALRLDDKADVVLLRRELKHLRKLAETLRHA